MNGRIGAGSGWETAATGQDTVFKGRWIQGFPGNSVVKDLPAIRETKVQSLRQEDPLEKEMATHSRILPWEIPWTEEADRLQSTGSQSWTQLSE